MVCRKCKGEIPADSLFCLKCGAKQLMEAPKRKPKRRGNGTGTAFKRGRTWTAALEVGKKICPKTNKPVRDYRTKGGFATKTEALEYIPNLRGRRASNRPTAETTLSTLWDGYSTSSMLKLSKSKQGHYRTAYSKMLKYESAIVNDPISSLKINDLQDMVDDLAPTYYPAKDIKNLLSHLYKRAMAQQDVNSNLADFIALPELEESEPKPFDEIDLQKLWQDYGAGNKISGYILLMIYSGMMPGELKKCDKTMIEWELQQIIGCGLKTNKRKETPILIADFMIPVLQDLCEYSYTDRLYVNYDGRFYKEFHEALSRCSIEDRTPYACRHTTATALALGNIAPEVIKEIMRHTKFSTTQRYIHKKYDGAPMLEALNTLSKKDKAKDRSTDIAP